MSIGNWTKTRKPISCRMILGLPSVLAALGTNVVAVKDYIFHFLALSYLVFQ